MRVTQKRRWKERLIPAAALLALLLIIPSGTGRDLEPVPEADLQRITEAVPEKPAAEPEAPRKILVFYLCEGFYHGSIPSGNEAFRILGEKTGAYETVVSEDMAVFEPESLARFDAVLFNNTTRLSFKDPAHREALMEFVKGGKGIIGIHAATDNFYDWPEAAAMMGGLFDGHPWGAGGTWAFKLDEPDHPLNRAFGGEGFVLGDEIYQIRDPFSRDDLRVLVSLDMTNPRNRQVDGIKREDGDFAVSWIREYGKGRVFYCSLGHRKEIFWNPAVLRHYLDGIQWALGDLEADAAPSANLDPKPEPALTTGWNDVDNPYSNMLGYTFGADRSALDGIGSEVRNAEEEDYPQIEAHLLRGLASPDATFEAKQFICRMLRIVGSDKSVPALAELLADPELSHMARFTLQRMPSAEADRVLLEALSRVEGRQLIGVVNSLGDRGSPESVPALADLVESDDMELSAAAIRALGLIGGPEAARALSRAMVPAELEEARMEALLLCADRTLADGKGRDALRVYRGLRGADKPARIRAAAWLGIARAEEEPVPTVLRMLGDRDSEVRMAAAQLVTEVEGSDATRALSGKIGRLSPEAEVLLITALAARADRAATEGVAEAVGGKDPAVRLAAIQALASLGGPSDVDLLVDAASTGDEEASAAYATLERLQGDGVGEAITERMPDVGPGVRAGLIGVLVARQDTDAVPAILEAASDPDQSVRLEALEALGKLGGEDVLPEVVNLVVDAPTEKDREKAADAAVAVAKRSPDPKRPATEVLTRLEEVTEVLVRCALLSVLGRLGVPDGLPPLRAALSDTETDIRKEAIRGLSEWPDPGPIEDLREMAENASSMSEHVLAMRGYARLLTLPNERPADEVAAMYAEGLELARRDDEKRTLLSGLGDVRHPKALEVAEEYLDNEAVKAEAQAASEKIQKLLDKPQQVSASHNSGEAGKAIDGDPKSRWGAGTAMKPGMWFLIDLGYERDVRGLVLDTSRSNKDYPRGYEVYVSSNQDSWGEPVVKGEGTQPVLDLEFEPAKARYVKIVQTGSADNFWWSIHELELKFGGEGDRQ